jgi:HD-GYP domain-containing protein (c-di-GMP phosphodiesterase class II)
MFVSALDKPWTDTPFLLQGFLIRSDAEIAALTRTCKHVFVDPERCTGAARDRFRRPAVVLPQKKGLWRRLLALLARPNAAKRRVAGAPSDERETLDARAVFRDSGHGIGPTGALVRAKETFERTKDALSIILGDIRMNRAPDIRYAENAVGQIIDSATTSPEALLWLTQLKDRDSCAYQHAIRVAIYMVAMGHHVALPRDQLHILGLAGLLQDVGKVRLPPTLIDKTTELNPEEFAVFKTHVTHSLTILKGTQGIPAEILDVVAQHHERHDGSGYPRGLAGSQISPFARIAGIADTFDGITTPGPGYTAMSTNDAMQCLYSWKGQSFHEGVVDQFIQSIGLFPVGTLVELNSGEVGIVIAQNRVRRLQPRLMLLLDSDKMPMTAPLILDLIGDPAGPGGVPYRVIKDLPAGSFGIDAKEFYL